MKEIQRILMSDKAMHFVYAFIAVSMLFSALHFVLQFGTALGASAIITIVFATLKEFFDNKFDVEDLGFGIAGAVFSAIIIFIQNAQMITIYV